MGEKDITEKHLEAYGDVFADIVNGTLLFGTGLKIEEKDLVDTGARTIYKSSGELHGQERDVVKLWKRIHMYDNLPPWAGEPNRGRSNASASCAGIRGGRRSLSDRKTG